MAPPSFDPAYPEPVHLPGDPVAVVASGARTVVDRVVLVRIFGEPVAYAYLGRDGQTYGASEIKSLDEEGDACGLSGGSSSWFSSPRAS